MVVGAFIGADLGVAVIPLSLEQSAVTDAKQNISKPINLPLLFKNAIDLADKVPFLFFITVSILCANGAGFAGTSTRNLA